jgi:RNA polymerase sigma-70 factor (ECF subfamily)
LFVHRLYNEEELILQVRNGSEDAFTRVYHHYSPQLYHKILSVLKDSLLAEELVQEIFTRIWSKRSSLDPARNFGAYLSTIAVNCVMDVFRKMKRDRILLERFRNAVEHAYVHVEEGMMAKECRESVEKAIALLSPQQHNVYQLCKVEGYTYKQAAEKLGISSHTVKEYLSAANKVIRAYMTQHSDVLVGMLVLSIATAIIK